MRLAAYPYDAPPEERLRWLQKQRRHTKRVIELWQKRGTDRRLTTQTVRAWNRREAWMRYEVAILLKDRDDAFAEAGESEEEEEITTG